MKLFRTCKPKRRAGRGSVLLIVSLLVTSALLRLAAGVDSAVAGGSPPKQPQTVAQTETAPPPAPQDRAEMGRLLTALQEREARVKQREEQLASRTKALNVAGEEIEQRLQALEAAEIRLRETLALADGAAESDLAKLTTVYESMKPKDAAALFQTMEPDFAAGFLGRMRPEAAAAIMAGLPPEIAYSVSAILAGRNAAAPKS